MYSLDGGKPPDLKEGNKIVYSKVKLTQYNNKKEKFNETLNIDRKVNYKNTEKQNKS